MKNCKTFCKAEATSHLKKGKTLLRLWKTLLSLWNKRFLKEIYRNIQTFSFKVLQECSSWASRNGAV